MCVYPSRDDRVVGLLAALALKLGSKLIVNAKIIAWQDSFLLQDLSNFGDGVGVFVCVSVC